LLTAAGLSGVCLGGCVSLESRRVSMDVSRVVLTPVEGGGLANVPVEP